MTARQLLPKGPAAETVPLTEGLRAIVPAVRGVVVFSRCINILMFVSPLCMPRVYDRVMSGRGIGTLIAITVVAGCLLAVYGLPEMLRIRVMVRAGVLFDQKLAELISIWSGNGRIRRQRAHAGGCPTRSAVAMTGGGGFIVRQK